MEHLHQPGLSAPDGEFAGIVSGTLKLDFLRQRLETLALGKGGVVSLFRDDGTVLVQNLPGNPSVGADWSRATLFKHLPGHTAGLYSSDGVMDHVPRLYAFGRRRRHLARRSARALVVQDRADRGRLRRDGDERHRSRGDV
jgi:hypothetical protein